MVDSVLSDFDKSEKRVRTFRWGCQDILRLSSNADKTVLAVIAEASEVLAHRFVTFYWKMVKLQSCTRFWPGKLPNIFDVIRHYSRIIKADQIAISWHV